jgi:hypothetical protein
MIFFHICDYSAERFGASQARRVADAIFETATSLQAARHAEPWTERLQAVPITPRIPPKGFLGICSAANAAVRVALISDASRR